MRTGGDISWFFPKENSDDFHTMIAIAIVSFGLKPEK
jgi:hypothetical protein